MKTLFVVLLAIVTFTSNTNGQKQDVSTERTSEFAKEEKVVIPPFRYTIVAVTSKIQRDVDQDRDYRHLVILMEDAAFTVENLKILFNLLSQRYSDRTGLYSRVFTSLEAIPTPEEYDMMNLYGPVENYRQYKNAYFSRDKRGKIIRYEIPGKIKLQQIFLGYFDEDH